LINLILAAILKALKLNRLQSSQVLMTSLRMPKQNKKFKGDSKKRAKIESAGGDVSDFDDMLAELRATDITTPMSSSSSRSSTNSPSSSSTSSSGSSTGNSASSPGMEVSEEQIIDASIRGDATKLRRWAKRGVRVRSGEALSQAVLNDNIAAVRCLVKDLGADVNRTDDDGFTPLNIAAQLANLNTIRCFVKELGADVDRVSKGGITALHIAAQEGYLAVVLCLVKELGADVNQASHNGCTPLYMAAQYRHPAVMVCLVKELGADVDRGDLGGCTPLYFAV
jgi:hypothetical protein